MPELDFGLWAHVHQRFCPTLSPPPFFPTGQRFRTLARGHVMSVSWNVLSFLNLSPQSIFATGQRFPISNHVTSGSLSPRSFFPTGQRFPIPNHVTSGSLSPRSFFPTGQRFSIPNHVTSGSHDVIYGHVTSPWAHYPYGQGFPLLGATQPPIRTQKALDQSEARTSAIWAPITTILLQTCLRPPIIWAIHVLSKTFDRVRSWDLYIPLYIWKLGVICFSRPTCYTCKIFSGYTPRAITRSVEQTNL